MEKMTDRFYSIPYISDRRLNMIDTSDYIYIEEKLDGSNASFNIDTEGNLRVYGRNYELNNTTNTLYGCYEWVQALDISLIKQVIGEQYTVYFEWLAKKKNIEYPDSIYGKGYIFSVKNNYTGEYLEQNKVYGIAKELKMNTVPLLYKGPFVSWEHAIGFVGESRLTDRGEGVVVKAQGNKKGIQSASGQRMIKIVAEEFKESMQCSGGTDFNKIDKRNQQLEQVKSIVTPARIEKAIYRVLEETGSSNNLDELTKEDLIKIKKPVISSIYRDCLKEESCIVNEVGKVFGAIVNNIIDEWISKEA